MSQANAAVSSRNSEQLKFAEAAEWAIELQRDAWKAGSLLSEQWEPTFRHHAAPLVDDPVDRAFEALPATTEVALVVAEARLAHVTRS